MNNFEEYRKKEGYSVKSIQVQNCHINHFKNWCIKQTVNTEQITYNQALQFINNERQRGILNQSIIREINSVRIYFDYLQESGFINQNVINGIKTGTQENKHKHKKTNTNTRK